MAAQKERPSKIRTVKSRSVLVDHGEKKNVGGPQSEFERGKMSKIEKNEEIKSRRRQFSLMTPLGRDRNRGKRKKNTCDVSGRKCEAVEGRGGGRNQRSVEDPHTAIVCKMREAKKGISATKKLHLTNKRKQKAYGSRGQEDATHPTPLTEESRRAALQRK